MKKLLSTLLILLSLQQTHAMYHLSPQPLSNHAIERIMDAIFCPNTLQQLIEEGFDINSKIDGNGSTALMKIAWRKGKGYSDREHHSNACKNLIAHGADVNLKNDNGHTALGIAISRNGVEICKILLNAGAHVNEQDDSIDSPLLLAADRSHYEICKMLIEHGADLDVQDQKYGATPLIFVSKSENLSQLLIDRGANVYLKDHKGDTIFSCEVTLQVRSFAEFIIVRSHISPICTQDQLQCSQRRTWARLAALKDTPLPKVLYESILSSNSEVWKDACNTPLRMHRGRYDRVHLLPLQITRYLIKRGALQFDKTVTALKAHKVEKLKPCFDEALHSASKWPRTFNGLHTVFDANSLEQNYGKEIEAVIAGHLHEQEGA